MFLKQINIFFKQQKISFFCIYIYCCRNNHCMYYYMNIHRQNQGGGVEKEGICTTWRTYICHFSFPSAYLSHLGGSNPPPSILPFHWPQYMRRQPITNMLSGWYLVLLCIYVCVPSAFLSCICAWTHQATYHSL